MTSAREAGPGLRSNWRSLRVRALIESAVNGSWGVDPEEGDSAICIRAADFDRSRLRVSSNAGVERGFSRADLVKNQLRPGDILLEKSGGGETQPVGKAVLVDQVSGPSVASNFLARLRPFATVEPAFLTLLLEFLYLTRINTCHIKQSTGIQNLDAFSYLNERVSVPALKEQRAIVRFLDEQTAKIDTLIHRKKQLLIKREEYFGCLTQELIQPHLATVRRLKFVAGGVTVGVVVNPSTFVDPDGSVRFLRGVDVRRFVLDLTTAKRISQESNDQLHKSKLEVGDIVSIRVGEPGVSAVVPPEADGANCASLLITRRSDSVDSRYLCYVFNSPYGQSHFRRLANGAAQLQVNVSDAVNFPVPFPPLDAQRAISDRLDREWGNLLRLRSILGAQLRGLDEYRSAVITAAVTGEIDVESAA